MFLIRRAPIAVVMLSSLAAFFLLCALLSAGSTGPDVYFFLIIPLIAAVVTVWVVGFREVGRQDAEAEVVEQKRALEHYASKLENVWDKERASRFRAAAVGEPSYELREIYGIFLSPACTE